MTDKSATAPPDGTLEPVKASRDQLEIAATNLELSLAHPSVTREWRQSVIGALDRTQAALETHVESTSGAGGLPASVIRAAPRLAGQATRLSDEHADLLDKHRQVTSMAYGSGSAPDEVRDAVAAHAALLLRHVRQAHDLLHDAIESELGGSD